MLRKNIMVDSFNNITFGTVIFMERLEVSIKAN